jgi:hypothetical protein
MKHNHIFAAALTLLPLSGALSYYVSQEARLKSTESGIIIGCTQGTPEGRKEINRVVACHFYDKSLGVSQTSWERTRGRTGCSCNHSRYCTIDLLGRQAFTEMRDYHNTYIMPLIRWPRDISLKIEDAWQRAAFPDVEANIMKHNVFSEFEDNSVPLFVSELRGYTSVLFTQGVPEEIYRIMRPGSLLLFDFALELTETESDHWNAKTHLSSKMGMLENFGFEILTAKEAFGWPEGDTLIANLYTDGAVCKQTAKRLLHFSHETNLITRLIDEILLIKGSRNKEIEAELETFKGKMLTPGLLIARKPFRSKTKRTNEIEVPRKRRKILRSSH